jgi:prepilin-type N-terminal cleavage/methylation domain-containing protein
MLTRLYSPAARERGFTLIELLVVIIIIGILAAIAIPLFLDQRKLAVDASVKSDVRNTATQVQQWRLDHELTSAANATEYTAADGKVVVSNPKNIIGVVAKADGSYTVCGYDTDGKQHATPETAWYYDYATGNFTLTTSGKCDGAVDANGNDASYTATKPKLADATLPDGKVGVDYSYQLTATGKPAPKFSGAVDGLTVNPDGSITGKPTAAGTFTLTVQAQNAAGTDTKDYTLKVLPSAVAPTITNTTTFYDAIIDSSFGTAVGLDQTIQVGPDSHVFSLDSGSLPPGIVLGTSVGSVSGTPTGTTGPTDYTFVVRAALTSDPTLYSTKQFTIRVHMHPKYNLTTDSFTMSAGSAVSGKSAAVTYGEGTILYQVAVGSYPAGASASTFGVTSAGVLTGTPTVAGTYTFSITATSAANYGSAVKSYTVTVLPAAGVNGTYTISDFEDGANYNGNTVNGWTVNWASAPSSNFYAVSPVSRATSPVRSGTGSLLSPSQSTNGTTGDFANTNVTISGLTVGKKYTLAGYFNMKTISSNGSPGTILTSGSSGFSNCTSTDRNPGASVAKGSWGSFTSLVCTASSTTGKFNLLTNVRLGGVTSNGINYDDVTLTQN